MKIWLRIFLVFEVAAISACNLVDEDVRDCPKDEPVPEEDYVMDYGLQLVTNMRTELETQLSMVSEVKVSAAMETYLKDIFTDYAHDVDLSFYDVKEDSVRLHHESHIMDASQSSYTLLIPARKYMHLAVANIQDNPTVSLGDDARCHTAALHQEVRDTLDSHRRGIFSARLPMAMKENEDQEFDVSLYMANCAAALVLDTLGCGVKDIKVFTSGFATDFRLADSTYLYRYTPVIRANAVPLPDASTGRACFVSVHFPSRPVPETKSSIDTEDPFVSESAENPLWQYRIYTRLSDGSITETLLGVRVPLKPGQLKLVKGWIDGDGAIRPGDEFSTTVAVSVVLNWDPGMSWTVDL